MTFSLTEAFDRVASTAGLLGMLAAVPLAGVLTVVQSLTV